jgi:hypothetical protein
VRSFTFYVAHPARQTEGGAWTSKLGEANDIRHAALHDLEGGIYGTVAHFFSKRVE